MIMKNSPQMKPVSKMKLLPGVEKQARVTLTFIFKLFSKLLFVLPKIMLKDVKFQISKYSMEFNKLK